MPYLIIAHDYKNQDEIREKLRTAHREYLKSAGTKILASGAILDDEEKNIIGGMTILDTENFSEAKKFADNDPYSKYKIRQTVQILKWRKRWWNGKFLLK